MHTRRIPEETERLAFARKAWEHFRDHPNHATYGLLEPNSYLAIRWGVVGPPAPPCAILVVKLADEEAVNYHDMDQDGAARAATENCPCASP